MAIRPTRHDDLDVMRECVRIDAVFTSWLMQHQDAPITPQVLRAAWRTAWVEGVIRERERQYEEQERRDILARVTGPIH